MIKKIAEKNLLISLFLKIISHSILNNQLNDLSKKFEYDHPLQENFQIFKDDCFLELIFILFILFI